MGRGANGDGIGEVVIAGLYNVKNSVRIWGGYGKSQATFKNNNRPQKVKLYLLVSHCPQVNQFACYYSNFKVIATSEIILKDVNGFQALPLPSIQKSIKATPCRSEGIEATYFIAIEILSVYKGLKYQDTCISEIQNRE